MLLVRTHAHTRAVAKYTSLCVQSLDDCWIVVNNRVYDVTEFLPSHPAGPSHIKRKCNSTNNTPRLPTPRPHTQHHPHTNTGAQIIRMYGGQDATEGFMDVHSEQYITNFAPNSFLGIIKGSGAAPAPSSRNKLRAQFDVNSVLCMPRTLYGPEHEAFRARWRSFLKKEVVPFYNKWDTRKIVDPNVYHKAAKAGFYLTTNIGKEWGGAAQGLTDWRYNAILCEETENLDVGGMFFNLGTDMCLSYYLHHMTPVQQKRWLPSIAAGDKILAVAMSEPEVGSDLAALGTTAIKSAGMYPLNRVSVFVKP